MEINERNYYGDIAGTFPYGYQSSLDVQNLCHIQFNNYYYYIPCGCEFQFSSSNGVSEIYCTNCYNSLEEAQCMYEKHYNKESPEVLYESSKDSVYFKLNKSHLNQINYVLKSIKLSLDFEYLEINLNIQDEYGYRYDVSYNKDLIKTHQLIDLYRYCLGKQIKKCLKKKKECCFIAEL